MKRITVSILSAIFVAFFSIPAFAGDSGGGHGGGGGGPAPLTFGAYCQNPMTNQAGPPGSVQPGDPDSCVIYVQSGQVPANSTVSIFLGRPSVDSMVCPGGTLQWSTPHTCVYSVLAGASSGAQIGRQDFRISASTPVFSRVSQMATVCSPSQPCQTTTVNTQGPGSEIHPPPQPPPPPSFPFAVAVCTGENGNGTASAGQLDHCVLTAFVGDSYNPGQSVIVKPFAPSGTTVADCGGKTTGADQTSGTITADGYCRLTVVSGTVRQFETLGTETVRLAGDAYPGSLLDQWVDFCNAPAPNGNGACLGTIGLIPVFGPGASVSPDPPMYANGISVQATEGQAYAGTVATFTDMDPTGKASEYAATIDWGDGTASMVGATGADAATSGFDVSGSHTYAEEGTYTITVSVSDIDTALFNTSVATSTVTVADAPLAASGRQANSTDPFNGAVAQFTDANPNGTLSDYSATIDWGDGVSSAGSIAQSGAAFDVTGTHTYAELGPHTVTTRVCDVGGSCAAATTQLLIYGLSDGGNFVIGDGNGASGSGVTFWGGQWASANTLSGGPAPESLKGFANDPASAPACGTSWTTRPANSAGPPARLPTYMAVTVASVVSKSGSQISGDTVEVVIVRTNTGYEPDPGHPGTGTVIAQLC